MFTTALVSAGLFSPPVATQHSQATCGRIRFHAFRAFPACANPESRFLTGMETLSRHRTTLETLRRFILVILLLGLLGIGVELLLVGHTEEPTQWVPLILIVLAFVVLGWHAALRGAAPVRVWQALMVLFMISGVVGTGLHWNGKMEFKKESNPSLTGLALFREAMKSESPPALAPGVMIQIGLLGLAYAFRHPALVPRSKHPSSNSGEDE